MKSMVWNMYIACLRGQPYLFLRAINGHVSLSSDATKYLGTKYRTETSPWQPVDTRYFFDRPPTFYLP